MKPNYRAVLSFAVNTPLTPDDARPRQSVSVSKTELVRWGGAVLGSLSGKARAGATITVYETSERVVQYLRMGKEGELF